MTQLVVKKPNKKNAEDALIPLINIVFLLLIFFMVAGSIQPSISVEVNHPVAAEVDNPIKPLTVQIVMTYQKDIYWNERKVSLKQLKQLMADSTPTKVNLHLDSQILAIDLEPVLNVIRSHKITGISLITQQQESF